MDSTSFSIGAADRGIGSTQQTPMSDRRVSRIGAEVGPVVFCILLIAVIVQYAGAGYDVTDQGRYVLTALRPKDVGISVYSDFLLTSLLVHGLGLGLRELRLAGVLLVIGGALAFAFGVRRLAPRLGFAPPSSIATIVVGGLASYSAFVLTPAYDLFASACYYLATGLSFYAATLSGTRRRLAWAALGLTIAFALFVCKFILGPLLFAQSLFVLVMIVRQPFRMRILDAGALGAGGALGALVFHLVWGLGRWWAMIAAGVKNLRLLTAGQEEKAVEGYVSQALQYASDLGGLAMRALEAFITVHLVVLIAWEATRSARIRGLVRRYPVLLLAPVLAIFVYAAWRGEVWIGGVLRLPFSSLGYAAAMLVLLELQLIVAAVQAGQRRLRLDALAWLALLFVSPCIPPFGTNIPMDAKMIYGVAGWFVLLQLQVGWVAKRTRARWFPFVVNSLVCLLVTLQVATAPLTPYQVRGTMSDQTKPFALPHPLGVVTVDEATQRVMLGLRDALTAAHTGPRPHILALCDAPGLVAALDGRSPGNPWYQGGWKGAAVSTRYSLQQVSKQELKSPVILLKGPPCVSDLASYLGTPFPGGYRQVYQGVWPADSQPVSLWVPVTQPQ